MNTTRIKRLYVKDLLDILRDRRTLIAMIVVPIILYPALMLGSLQAASMQAEQLKQRPLVIGVQTESVGGWLQRVLLNDAQRVQQQEARAESEGVALDPLDPVTEFKIVVLSDHPNIRQWVRREGGDCAVVFDTADLPVPKNPWSLEVRRPKVIADSAEVRSAMAGRRVRRALERHGWYILEVRNQAAGRPEAYIKPVIVQEIDVASAAKRGGSMLGQIIPIILILMTMTGAIYPAIDLTAGERERGTLETLMVCPIPLSEIMVGKFLVVASVSLIGAFLNLFSMGLTLQFGGFKDALATGAETEIPLGALPLILLFLIPLSVFFSALLLAVCSFARSFKEAQNYITPVILAVLVPAGLAALPSSELQGVMTVMPVANMVLLTREMLLGNFAIGTTTVVLLSNCLYAAAAVAIAVRVFGQEAVLFGDAGSWRAQFDRRLIQPSEWPKPALALLYVALLFPIWFYIQNGMQLQWQQAEQFLPPLQVAMVLCFAILPLLLVVYYKVNPRNAFAWLFPKGRYLLGAVLAGCSTWVLAHELTFLQKSFAMFGVTDDWLESIKPFAEQVATMSPVVAVILLGVIPGVCEELLFRGLLLNSLRRVLPKWSVILAVGFTFAVYHYLIQRFLVTCILGIFLAYLCWQSRSVIPAMITHVLHNGIQVVLNNASYGQALQRVIGLDDSGDAGGLPLPVLLGAGFLLILALLLFRKPEPAGVEHDALGVADLVPAASTPSAAVGLRPTVPDDA